jgi:signal transduction histidine kinase
LDLAAAVAILVALAPPMRTSVPIPLGAAPPVPPEWFAWVTWLLAVGVAVAVVVRRFWPLPAFAVIVVASTVSVALLHERWPGTIATTSATALALYSVAATKSGRVAVAALTAGVVLSGGAGVLGPTLATNPPARESVTVPLADTLGQVLFGCLLLGAAWAVGRAASRERTYAARAAEQSARQALSDERQRIARELHDIVAHSMSLIAVKAGVANHVADARPHEAREALHLIESTSRSALVELRRVLDVLRADIDETEELSPAPDLAGLDALVKRAAAAGVAVEAAVPAPSSFPDDTVPPGVQLSAYRIVQEALTNVVKHAGPVPCRVTVMVAPDAVHIEVSDDGPPVRRSTGAPRPGHGLVGMRERVATYGGALTAGPRPGGGFAVCATLPYQPVS